MAATNTNVAIPALTWTELTTADVTNISFQNRGGSHLLVKATVGAVAPTDILGAWEYPPYQGENNIALATWFAGVTSATRVYGWCNDKTLVSVSHA